MIITPTNLPTYEYLDGRPTITEGYTCDLKIDAGDGMRIWLHRTSIEDGEPFRNTVTIECRDENGRWLDVLTYDGDDPTDQSTWIWNEDGEHLIDPYQREDR